MLYSCKSKNYLHIYKNNKQRFRKDVQTHHSELETKEIEQVFINHELIPVHAPCLLDQNVGQLRYGTFKRMSAAELRMLGWWVANVRKAKKLVYLFKEKGA